MNCVEILKRMNYTKSWMIYFRLQRPHLKTVLVFDCDLQLVQRRKEKSKSFARDIWEMYTYITGLSEYFPTDILNSQCKQSTFGDERVKPDNHIQDVHISAEHDDVRMNVKHLSVQQQYVIAILKSKVDAQEKQNVDFQRQEKKIKNLFDILLDRLTGREMLIKDINTESGAFKK